MTITVNGKSMKFHHDYQDQVWGDSYSTKLFAPDFESRKEAFYEQVLLNKASGKESKRAVVEVARLAANGEPDEGIIHTAITEFIEKRKDCADFVMAVVLRILYQFNTAAKKSFNSELLAHAKSAVLDFKYWPDEPGDDSMCTWTENHHILFSSAAFLAGQLFPDLIFTNSGRTGRELMKIQYPRINRWLEMRFKTGFSEWLSNVYYDEDWAALLNLVDFAADVKLRNCASLVVDVSLLDVALNSFQGVFGSTHGRSYQHNTRWAALEGTSDVTKLLFGTGSFSGYELFSAAFFAMSERYRVTQVIIDIANNHAPYTNRQRMGHRTEDAGTWGLSYDDPESAMVFFSNADFLHPKNVALTLKTFDKFNWWDHPFHQDFKTYRKALTFLHKFKLLPALVWLFKKDLSRNVRDEVNIYTYRTPDYMLSSAQDYRPGYGGNQHHIWQATLGPNAVCFTTYPANQRRTGSTPNYWTGNGSLPRVAQVENVVIAIYNIHKLAGITIPNKLSFTHAWLPKDQFDEHHEQDGWLFVRKGEGYLALRSMKPVHWQEKPGEGQYREIIAEGKKNVWICELGRRETNGNFKNFRKQITNSELTFKGLSVKYQSPSQGMIKFSWKDQLTVDGQMVKLDNYPRYDNPYCQADFLGDDINIQYQDRSLKLDWKSGERKLT